MNVTVIIPALNEAGSIADLVAAALAQPINEVVVVDNGSTDDTAGVARKAGARLVTEARRGYGSACAAGAAPPARLGARQSGHDQWCPAYGRAELAADTHLV